MPIRWWFYSKPGFSLIDNPILLSVRNMTVEHKDLFSIQSELTKWSYE